MNEEKSAVLLQSNPPAAATSSALTAAATAAMAAQPQLELHWSGEHGRDDLEHYIHDRFAREYGADINRFMPCLLTFGTTQQVYATLGFRKATGHRLFLETYLDKPVEAELAEITGLQIVREKIIEVGNLAATKPGSSAPLFAATACFLDRIGYEWVVISATPTVQNVFSKLRIPLISMADADESALPADQKQLWGTYYRCHPQVMAVHVKTAHRCIRESAIGNRLLDSLAPALDSLVTAWDKANV